MTVFGPRRSLWVAALVGLALVAAFVVTGGEHVLLAVGGAAALFVTLPGWNWYRLDAEGIHRHGIAGRKVVPWHAVDTVLSRETVHDKTGRRIVTPFVVDARDRALLRLDGWVAHRGHLVRLILATARARQTARRRTVSRRPHDPARPPR